MSEPKIIHDKGEFQLNRKELGIDAGMVGNALVDKVFDALNNLNLNHNQKSDIAEIAPLVIKIAPVLMQLAPLINADGVKDWALSHKEFFHDVAEAAKKIEAAAKVAAEAAEKFAPKA